MSPGLLVSIYSIFTGEHMRGLSAVGAFLCFGFLMACGGGEGGSSSDSPTADCRTEGNGCTGDLSCQMNADGAYECMPFRI